MENEPKTAPVTDAPVTPPVIAPVVPEPETIESLKLKLEAEKQHALNKEEEAARHFKKLQAFEKTEQDKKDAELSELQKEQKRTAELEKENKELKTNQIKLSIATKIGLPEVLALRLQGETPADIEADAKAILETLPKKAPANGNPTNPGGGSQAVETDAERRKRLLNK
jgi:hypothetical protein